MTPIRLIKKTQMVYLPAIGEDALRTSGSHPTRVGEGWSHAGVDPRSIALVHPCKIGNRTSLVYQRGLSGANPSLLVYLKNLAGKLSWSLKEDQRAQNSTRSRSRRSGWMPVLVLSLSHLAAGSALQASELPTDPQFLAAVEESVQNPSAGMQESALDIADLRGWNECYRLVINGTAIHLTDSATRDQFNESNWGLGLEYEWKPEKSAYFQRPLILGGFLEDSVNHTQWYIGVGAKKRLVGNGSFHIDLGASAGISARKDYHDRRPFPYILPFVSVVRRASTSTSLTYLRSTLRWCLSCFFSSAFPSTDRSPHPWL